MGGIRALRPLTGRVVAVLALLAGGVGASPAVQPPAAAKAAVARTWWVYRTAAKPTAMKLRIAVQARDGSEVKEGTLLTLQVYGRGRDRVLGGYGIGGFGADMEGRTYGIDGLQWPACGAPCTAVGEAAGIYHGSVEMERSESETEWFVAVHNLDATLTVSKGWRIKEIPNRLAVLDAARTQAKGFRSNNTSVERFAAAELPGGPRGSFVHAVIPCTSAGIGSATLSGGRSYREGRDLALSCADYDAAFAEAFTWRATRWSLRGDVVGTTSWPTRLTVFNLPW